MSLRHWTFILLLVLTAAAATAGEIHEAVEAGDLARVRALVSADAELLEQPGDDRSFSLPLHIAARSGHLEIAEYLIAGGADVESLDKENTTPLMVACFRGKDEVARLLLRHGADPAHSDDNEMNALSYCAFRGNGATAELLLGKGLDHEKVDRFGRTPLYCSVQSGNREVTDALLKAGADPNLVGMNGQTCLIVAAASGDLAGVEQLLEAGSRIDPAEAALGRQALHFAAARGYGDIAAALVKAGAPLSAADSAGATPVTLARSHGNDKIAEALGKAGAKSCVTTNACQAAGTVKKCPAKPATILTGDEAPARGDARVWYLGHSSMAVQTRGNLLIFDYYPLGRDADSPCLANGRISPDEIAGRKVTVFASHEHGDHYDPVIFEWREKVADITYVLGFEPDDENVPAHESIGPRQTRKFGDVTVHTIASNDSGVGFLVEVDGVSIFHAGDHANRNRDLSGDYCPEIEYLIAAGHHPDLTMLPTSGCQFGDQVAVSAGLRYTLEKFGATTFFPMHAGRSVSRYAEIWDEIGPQLTQVEAVIPRDVGDAYDYRGDQEHAMN